MQALSVKVLLQKWLRAAGLEVSHFRNANVEQQLVARVLRLTGARVVLDVGANTGQYGELLWATGFDGTLLSFEALPEAHRQLVERARRSRRSWLVAACAALGRQSGEVELNVSANSASSSVLPMLGTHLRAAPQARYIGKQAVRLERMDQLAEGIVPIDKQVMIKIDTQGYEMEVLEGATALLPRTVAIQLELSLVPLYEGAPSFRDMIGYLEARGFELFGLVPEFVDHQSGRLLQVDGFFVRGEQLTQQSTASDRT